MKRAQDAGIWMINVGTAIETSKSAVVLAETKGDGVFATVGMHPSRVAPSFFDSNEFRKGEKAVVSGDSGMMAPAEVFDYGEYKKLALHPKTVAIGECGLDFFRNGRDTEKEQTELFAQHIALANEVGKPLMLHIRNAYKEALALLKSSPLAVRGNVHFFAGSLDDARDFLDLGFTLSFTGVITFARNYDEIIRFAPLTSIMSETDSPDVSPVPMRGRRNEPLFVREVAKEIARIRNGDVETVQNTLVSNAKDFFSLASFR
jgi:TatD DNase family protein